MMEKKLSFCAEAGHCIASDLLSWGCAHFESHHSLLDKVCGSISVLVCPFSSRDCEKFL